MTDVWAETYEKCISGGMSHREALHWARLADIRLAQSEATHPVEIDRLAKVMAREVERAPTNNAS